MKQIRAKVLIKRRSRGMYDIDYDWREPDGCCLATTTFRCPSATFDGVLSKESLAALDKDGKVEAWLEIKESEAKV